MSSKARRREHYGARSYASEVAALAGTGNLLFGPAHAVAMCHQLERMIATIGPVSLMLTRTAGRPTGQVAPYPAQPLRAIGVKPALRGRLLPPEMSPSSKSSRPTLHTESLPQPHSNLRLRVVVGNGGSSPLLQTAHHYLLPTVPRMGHYTGVQRTRRGS